MKMSKKLLSVACAVAMTATMFTGIVANAYTATEGKAFKLVKDTANSTDTKLAMQVKLDDCKYVNNFYIEFDLSEIVDYINTKGVAKLSKAPTNFACSPSVGYDADKKILRIAGAKGSQDPMDLTGSDGVLMNVVIPLSTALPTDKKFTISMSEKLRDIAPVYVSYTNTYDEDAFEYTGYTNMCPAFASISYGSEAVDAAPTVAIAADTTTTHSKAGYIWDVTITPNTAKSNTAITSMNAKFTDSNSNVKNNAIKGDFSKFKGAGAIGMKVGLATNRTVNSFEFSATNSTGTGTDTWNAQ